MFYSPRLKFHLSLAAPKESFPAAISPFPRLPTEPPGPCQTKLSFYSINLLRSFYLCVSVWVCACWGKCSQAGRVHWIS